MTRWVSILVLLFGLSAQRAAATLNDYQDTISGPANTANIDTYIYQFSATTNFGTTDPLIIGLGNGSTRKNRIILEYDISDMGSGNTVTACTLTVVVPSAVSAPTAGHIYQLLGAHWLDGDGQGEAQATWNVWKTSNNWTTAGADSSATDYTTTNGVAFTPPSGTGAYTFPDMTALCQDALDNQSGILRLLLFQDAETTNNTFWKFDSSDTGTGTNRPHLAVTFTPPTPGMDLMLE